MMRQQQQQQQQGNNVMMQQQNVRIKERERKEINQTYSIPYSLMLFYCTVDAHEHGCHVIIGQQFSSFDLRQF